MRVIGAVLLAAAAALPAAAQCRLFPPAQMARIQEGLRDIYSLDHARAAANFERMVRESPDDPAGYAYLAATLWLWELSARQELSIDRFAASDFFSEGALRTAGAGPKAEERFRRVSEQAIERARRRLASAPKDKTSLFLLGLAYQNLASFEAALKRNWWAAFRYGVRTYGYDTELLRIDPECHDARLATGVYNYAAGSLGWSARWLALLMGYRGSRERGKTELETAARRGQLAADDARVMLVLIYTRERNYARALGYLEELRKRYPRNYLVHLDIAGIALRTGEPRRAIEIYENVLRRREAGEPNYSQLERALLYDRLGAACRRAQDFAASEAWFGKALAEPNISPRGAAIAHLELGKTLDLAGRRADALKHYRLAAQAADFAGSRREAQEGLRRAYREK